MEIIATILDENKMATAFCKSMLVKLKSNLAIGKRRNFIDRGSAQSLLMMKIFIEVEDCFLFA
jgi:hypothetical protein